MSGKLYRESGGILVPHGTEAFEYDATASKGRRQAPKARTASNDTVLTPHKRRTLQATAQNQARNLSLLAWMIRKHITYVSQFTPYLKTKAPEVDRRLLELFAWHARRRNFDIAGRHGRDRAMMLFESGKVVNGDCAWLHLKGGQSQFIPSDRITKPKDLPKSLNRAVNEHGLDVDPYGRVKRFCICKRDGKEILYSHMEKADHVVFDGYYDSFDQLRGVSPLSSALNTIQDTYELFEYTLIKTKLHAVFGLAISRDAEEGGSLPTMGGADEDGEGGSGEEGQDYSQIDLSKPGLVLDLDEGDQVNTIESATPNPEVLDFSMIMVRVALLALDIPYTMFDSMKSSFSARKSDRVEYEEACGPKRRANQECLSEYDHRAIRRFARSDAKLAELMATHKVDEFYLMDAMEWLPLGRPWYDEKDEVSAATERIANGLSSRQREGIIHGVDFWKIADELAEEELAAKNKGFTLTIGQPGSNTTSEPEANSKQPPAGGKEDE